MSKLSKKPKPVHNIRLGRIVCAIWKNETDNGIRHNVTFSRLYKPEGEDWQDRRVSDATICRSWQRSPTWPTLGSSNRPRTKRFREGERNDAPPQEQEGHF